MSYFIHETQRWWVFEVTFFCVLNMYLSTNSKPYVYHFCHILQTLQLFPALFLFPPWCNVQVISNKVSMDYFFDSVSKRRLFFSNVVLFIEQVTQYVVYDEIWQLISLCKSSWIWHSIFEYMYVVWKTQYVINNF